MGLAHKHIFKLALLVFLGIWIVGCTEVELVSHAAKTIGKPQQGNFKVGNPYKIQGKWYRPVESYNHVETGIASWYGPGFHGKRTANGEIFDENELTAAHRTLQMPSLVRVTNLENGRSLIVRINDRGPFSRGRIIDLSKRGAELLGFKNQGTAKVRVEVLKEESLSIASAAKQGKDVRGIEVAMNESRDQGFQALSSDPPPQNVVTYRTPPAGAPPQTITADTSLTPVETEMLRESPVPGHINQGRFMPDPIVRQVPVAPTNIYVQAGSFGEQANAMRHAASLSRFGNAQVVSANVQGRIFYRVRFGPMNSVPKADELLNNLLLEDSSEAIIVVE